MSPVLLHAVAIDHVRAPEMIALAISRPDPVMSPELRTIRFVGFASCVFWLEKPVPLPKSEESLASSPVDRPWRMFPLRRRWCGRGAME